MVSHADFYNHMCVGPDIWVPPGVADFLFSRMQWIKDGEHTNFQIRPPPGFDFNELATLSFLIVDNDLGAARMLADNLPRSPTWMEQSSSSLVEGNRNYTLKNPFKRRSGKQRRRKKNGAVEKDGCGSSSTEVF